MGAPITAACASSTHRETKANDVWLGAGCALHCSSRGQWTSAIVMVISDHTTAGHGQQPMPPLSLPYALVCCLVRETDRRQTAHHHIHLCCASADGTTAPNRPCFTRKLLVPPMVSVQGAPTKQMVAIPPTVLGISSQSRFITISSTHPIRSDEKRSQKTEVATGGGRQTVRQGKKKTKVLQSMPDLGRIRGRYYPRSRLLQSAADT